MATLVSQANELTTEPNELVVASWKPMGASQRFNREGIKAMARSSWTLFSNIEGYIQQADASNMAARQALVKDAMARLKTRKGTTLAQIQQQLESSYSGKIDMKNKRMLTTALKGLVEKGQVEKQGANYKLVRVAKLPNAEEDDMIPGRRHRRRRRLGGSTGRGLYLRRRYHRRRRHHRRRPHSRRRRHHSRRRGHHRRRRSRRPRR